MFSLSAQNIFGCQANFELTPYHKIMSSNLSDGDPGECSSEAGNHEDELQVVLYEPRINRAW